MRLPFHLVLVLFFVLCGVAAEAQEPVQLWGAEPRTRHVTLTPYIAEGGDGTAVIVCPGGSYCWLDGANEGDSVAAWLQSQGISAFVLRYRVAGWWAWFSHSRLVVRGNQYPDASDDLRQALRFVRSKADDYGVDTSRIGLMGFSAGGHLVMSVALQQTASQPDIAFVVSVYPVVTMMEPYVHKRSRRGLMGEYRRGCRADCEQLSVERHVTSSCPPVFIVNCLDDATVDYHNSVLLDSALTAARVPHRYVQYSTGGHGFGVSVCRGTSECRAWKQECLTWINNILTR